MKRTDSSIIGLCDNLPFVGEMLERQIGVCREVDRSEKNFFKIVSLHSLQKQAMLEGRRYGYG